MADKPDLGNFGFDLDKAIAATRGKAKGAIEDLEKAAEERRAALREGDAEAERDVAKEVERGGRKKAVRGDSTRAAEQESAAVEQSEKRLAVETGAVDANTEAWTRNAAARERAAVASNAANAASRHGGFNVGQQVLYSNPYGDPDRKRLGEVAGLQRNQNLRVRDPLTNTTVDVPYKQAVAADTQALLQQRQALLTERERLETEADRIDHLSKPKTAGEQLRRGADRKQVGRYDEEIAEVERHLESGAAKNDLVKPVAFAERDLTEQAVTIRSLTKTQLKTLEEIQAGQTQFTAGKRKTIEALRDAGLIETRGLTPFPGRGGSAGYTGVVPSGAPPRVTREEIEAEANKQERAEANREAERAGTGRRLAASTARREADKQAAAGPHPQTAAKDDLVKPVALAEQDLSTQAATIRSLTKTQLKTLEEIEGGQTEFSGRRRKTLEALSNAGLVTYAEPEVDPSRFDANGEAYGGGSGRSGPFTNVRSTAVEPAAVQEPVVRYPKAPNLIAELDAKASEELKGVLASYPDLGHAQALQLRKYLEEESAAGGTLTAAHFREGGDVVPQGLTRETKRVLAKLPEPAVVQEPPPVVKRPPPVKAPTPVVEPADPPVVPPTVAQEPPPVVRRPAPTPLGPRATTPEEFYAEEQLGRLAEKRPSLGTQTFDLSPAIRATKAASSEKAAVAKAAAAEEVATAKAAQAELLAEQKAYQAASLTELRLYEGARREVVATAGRQALGSPIPVAAGGGGARKPPVIPVAAGAAGGGGGDGFRIKLLGESAGADAAANSLDNLAKQQARVNQILRVSAAELAASSTALTRHGALSTEFIGALARGEVTLQEFGTATLATIGKFGGWAVAGGLVYGVYDALKHVAEGAKAASTQATQLERTALPGFSRSRAEQSFLDISRELNVPIGGKSGVGEAEFYAARAGFRNQPEVEKVASTALEAQKLDLVPIQDSTKAFGALHVAFGLTADEIHHVFEELDVGQLHFNARLNQTLPFLGRAASAVANAGGDVHELVQQIVTVTGATGGGGGSGGGNPSTFFLREPGNLRKPTAKAALEELIPDIFKRELDEPNVTRFNKELAERAGKLSQDERSRLAEAIGGGTANAGRYGIALVNAGPSGRLREVEQGVGHPGNALAQDLSKKVDQFDEQVARIGHSFERLGIELGKVGLTSVAEDIVGIFGLIAEAAERVAQPLGHIGELFGDIPGPVQQAVIALGGLALATKVNRSDKVLGLSKVASEALPSSLRGYVYGPDKQFEGAFKRTLSEERRVQDAEIESLDRRKVKRGPEIATVLSNKEGFERRGEQNSEEALAEELKFRKLDSEAHADEALAIRTHVARIRTEGLQSIADSGKSRAAIAAEAAAAGVVVPLDRGLVGAEGPEGARFKALQQVAAEGNLQAEAGSEIAEKVKIAGAQIGAAGASGAEQAAAGYERVAAASQEGASEIAAAMAASAAEIKTGGVEIAAAEATSALAIGGGGLAGGLGGKLGGLAGGLEREGGGLLKSLGGLGGKVSGLFEKGSLFKAFNIGLFGSLGAELAGEAIGGKPGKAVGGIGSDIALGAAAGAIIPIPGVGPVAGAVAGGLFGVADQLGLFGGGGSGASKAVEQQKRREAEIAEALKRAIKPTTAAAALTETSDAWAGELETAFGEDAKAADAAQKHIDKGLKAAAANLKLFAPSTVRGGKVTDQLLAEGTATVENILKSPKTIDKSAAILEQIEQATFGTAEAQFDKHLKVAKTLGQVDAAVGQAQDVAKKSYAALYQTPLKDAKREQQEAEATLASLTGQSAKEQVPGHLRLPAIPSTPRAALEQLERENPQSKPIPQFNDKGQTETDSDYEAAIKSYESRKATLEKRVKSEEHLSGLAPKLRDAERNVASKERQRSRILDERTKEEAALGQALQQPRPADPKQAALQEQHVGNLRQRISEYRDNEKNVLTEIAKVEREEAKLGAEAAAHGTSKNPAVQKKIAAANKEIQQAKEIIKQLEKELGPFFAHYEEFAGEQSVLAGVERLSEKNKTGNARKLAEAGPDPAAKAKVQAEIDKRERAERGQLPGVKKLGHLPKSLTDEEVTTRITEQEEAGKREVEAVERREKRELARLPAGASANRTAAIQTRAARDRVGILERLAHDKRASSSEVEEAITALDSAEKGSAEKVGSEASALISAEGARAQARDEGNALAQARDALATAQRQLGAAKTPAERVNAEADVIRAQNDIRKQRIQHIGLEGETAESKALEPLARDRIKISTLKKEIPLAKGEERVKLQNQLRDEQAKFAEAKVTEAEDEYKTLEHLGRLTVGQRVSKLQQLLRSGKKLSQKERLQLESEIYDAEAGAEKDFAVGSIGHVPTLYDAKTLSLGRAPIRQARVEAEPPTVTRQRAQPTGAQHHLAPKVDMHNIIHISINGAEHGRVAHELERVFGSLTRAQLRSARLT